MVGYSTHDLTCYNKPAQSVTYLVARAFQTFVCYGQAHLLTVLYTIPLQANLFVASRLFTQTLLSTLLNKKTTLYNDFYTKKNINLL